MSDNYGLSWPTALTLACIPGAIIGTMLYSLASLVPSVDVQAAPAGPAPIVCDAGTGVALTDGYPGVSYQCGSQTVVIVD